MCNFWIKNHILTDTQTSDRCNEYKCNIHKSLYKNTANSVTLKNTRDENTCPEYEQSVIYSLTVLLRTMSQPCIFSQYSWLLLCKPFNFFFILRKLTQWCAVLGCFYWLQMKRVRCYLRIVFCPIFYYNHHDQGSQRKQVFVWHGNLYSSKLQKYDFCGYSVKTKYSID